MFGRWFNHLAMYAGLWGGSLLLLDLHLLPFYPIQDETWVLVVTGWASFLLGSVIVFLLPRRNGLSHQSIKGSEQVQIQDELKLIARFTWLLAAVALLGAFQHWNVLIAKFGSLQRVILMANVVYSLRTQAEIPGMVPYVDSLALTACFFAGMIASGTGRLKLVSIFPLIVMVIAEFAVMGRARLILAAILFASGYSIYGFRVPHYPRNKGLMIRRGLTVLLAVILFAWGADLIRSTRGGNESFHGASRALNVLKGGSFITPSIYLYVTGNFAVFDQYLRDEREITPLGSNAFSPVYNILNKMGFDTEIPAYQLFYHTPYSTNTGTYLKEVHADFGLLGVLIVPLLLGAMATSSLLRLQRRFSFMNAVWLSYLYTIIGMSLFVIATRLGSLLVFLLIGLAIARFLDRNFNTNAGLSALTNSHEPGIPAK